MVHDSTPWISAGCLAHLLPGSRGQVHGLVQQGDHVRRGEAPVIRKAEGFEVNSSTNAMRIIRMTMNHWEYHP